MTATDIETAMIINAELDGLKDCHESEGMATALIAARAMAVAGVLFIKQNEGQGQASDLVADLVKNAA